MIVKNSVIRTIYLYLFTLIGLALMVVGTVRLLDMGLKMFVFIKAEEPEKIQSRYIPSPVFPLEKLEQAEQGSELTEEEKIQLKRFLEDYKKFQEEQGKIDYLTSNRQREASNSIAMILVGLPLYLYHWRIIRRETKEA